MTLHFQLCKASLLAILGLAATASLAKGQGNSFNPYGNSGYADYREFSTPMYGNNPALPGQALLNSRPTISRRGANSYQQYTNELDASDPYSPDRRPGGSSLPHFQAYQRLNSQYNRVYQPNNTEKDRKFYERQRLRNANYAKALEETDPLKRAKLLRAVELDSIDYSKPTTRPDVVTRKNAAPAIGSPATSARRTPAPSPFPSTTNRAGAAGRSVAPPPATLSRPASRPAPDPSTIPLPPPR